MKIIQRYILREVLIMSLLAIAIMTFLLLARTVFRSTDDIAAGALTLGASLKILLHVMPTVLSLAVPISLLVGVLLAIGRLAVDSEIKACRTHGVNLWKAFYPVVILGAVVSFFGVLNSTYFAPYLMGRTFTMIDELTFEVVNTLEPGKFENRFGIRQHGAILHFAELDPKTRHMRKVFLQVDASPEALGLETEGDAPTTPTRSSGPIKTLILASSGLIETDTEERTAMLTLFNGTIHVLEGGTDKRYSILEFDQWTQNLEISSQLTLSSEDADELTVALTNSDLGEIMRRTEASVAGGAGGSKMVRQIRHLRAERFTRVSIGMASFAFILIAIPLAIYIRPSGKSVGVSIAFGLFMAYYGFFYTGMHLTREGFAVLGPVIILAPIFLLSGIGAFLMYRVVHR